MSAVDALNPLNAIAGWVDGADGAEQARRMEIYEAFYELVEAVERSIDPDWSPRLPEQCALRHARVVQAVDRVTGRSELPTIAALARVSPPLTREQQDEQAQVRG